MSQPRAVVLLSGGLDSATTLAVARDQGFSTHALSFRYGQRHSVELEAAKQIATALGAAEHVIAEIDLRMFGGSALTADLAVPKNRRLEEMQEGVPATYVPARNTIFLSFALAWAEVLGATDVFIGVNALDAGGYPDCRLKFIRAYEELARVATRTGVEGRQPLRIHAPLIERTKSEIIALGKSLGVDYALTRTCYDPAPDGAGCAECDACILRRKAFADLGMQDPAPYQASAQCPTQ
jgi:7-cyano-7-deazaguanine synthase